MRSQGQKKLLRCSKCIIGRHCLWTALPCLRLSYLETYCEQYCLGNSIENSSMGNSVGNYSLELPCSFGPIGLFSVSSSCSSFPPWLLVAPNKSCIRSCLHGFFSVVIAHNTLQPLSSLLPCFAPLAPWIIRRTPIPSAWQPHHVFGQTPTIQPFRKSLAREGRQGIQRCTKTAKAHNFICEHSP